MAKKSVTLSILADVSEYAAGMRKIPGVTEKQAAASAKRMEAALLKGYKASVKDAKQQSAKAGKAWGAAAGSIKAAFAAVGVAAIAKGWWDLQQSIADAQNELLDASTRTGIAAETLNGLRLAAEGSGLEFSKLEGSLNRFPKVIGDTAKGIGEARDAFGILGVEVKNSSGGLRDSDAVFKDVVAGLGKVESTTERAALATEIFGRAGGSLLQALGDPKALDAFVTTANTFGTKVGPDAAQAAADWQREVADLKNVFRGSAQALLDFGGDGALALEGAAIAVVMFTTTVQEGFQAASNIVSHWGKGWTALFRGDIAEATREFAKGSMVQIFDSFVGVTDKAEAAGIAYQKLQDETQKTATVTAEAAEETVTYADGLKKAADAANELRDAIKLDMTAFEELAKLQNELAEQNADDAVLFRIDKDLENLEILKESFDGLAERQAEVNELIDANREEAARRRLAIVEETAAEERRISEVKAAEDAREARAQAEMTSAKLSGLADLSSAIADGSQKNFALVKAASLAEATILGIQSVMAAAASLPPPANLIPIGAATAFAAVQIAKISSQQPPTAHGGLASARTGPAPDEMDLRVTRRERVLTARGASAAGGDAGIARMNRGQSGGGGTQVAQVYKHRVLDTVLYDNVRRSGPLRSQIKDIASTTGKLGRSRS